VSDRQESHVRDKFHVLIVSAELQTAAAWEQSLERAGYLVSHVTTGGAALRRWEVDRIDAAIIDAALSDMSAATLARVLRERWPKSQVLLSAGAAEAGMQLASDAHLQLLPKSVTARVLKKRLEQLLPYPAAVHTYPLAYPHSAATHTAGRA
jgi:DNA-binding response OmpR family regulator